MPNILEVAKITGLAHWREGINGHGHDAEFERIWDGELRAKVVPLIKDGAIESALPLLRSLQARATEARPRLEAAKHLEGQLNTAKKRFLDAGGLTAEWDREKDSVRGELLRDAAMGKHNDLSDEDERKIRIAHASGLRSI